MLKQMAFFLGGLLVLPLATGLSVSATAETVKAVASDVVASDVVASDVVASDVVASDVVASDAAASSAATAAGGLSAEAAVAKAALRALPDRLAAPEVELESGRKAADALACLRRQLSVKMGLPDEFVQLRDYANNVQTLALHNPFTHKDGVFFDVHQHTLGSSVIRLYANGTTLSGAWRSLPAACR